MSRDPDSIRVMFEKLVGCYPNVPSVCIDGKRIGQWDSPSTSVVITEGAASLARKGLLLGIERAPSILGLSPTFEGPRLLWDTLRSVGTSKCTFLPRPVVNEFVDRNSSFGEYLAIEAAQRAHRISENLNAIITQEPDELILRLLFDYATVLGDDWTVKLRQRDVARYLRLNRKTVSRKLKDLEARGQIRTEPGRVVRLLVERRSKDSGLSGRCSEHATFKLCGSARRPR